MLNKKYDVLVIGGGVAGCYCSICLSIAGKTVALIEKESLGGVALRWGALPVKRILDAFKMGKGQYLIDNWDNDIKNLEEKIYNNIKSKNLDIYLGNGEFLDNRSYKINNQVLKGDFIIIASGTKPVSTGMIPIDKERIITHKEAINLKNIPKSIIILGGNVEGVEFAAIYAEMGSQVTIIEKENRLLPDFDADLTYPVESSLTKKGTKIIKGIGAKRAIVKKDKVFITLENGEVQVSDKALLTLLRKPSYPKGIGKLDIKYNDDKIFVDENFKTSSDHIFALGDINGVSGMAHTAIDQGIKVANYIANDVPIKTDYSSIPRAVFTLPEIAGAGKQEWELREQAYKIYKYEFKNTWRGWAKDIESGFVKVIANKIGNVQGIWMVGDDVSEYLGLLDILIKKGLTIDDIRSGLIIHPSLTEALLEAILSGPL